MSDQLKDIKRKIDISKDVHEKIDLQNQLAWELRLTDLRQSLTTAEQVCQAALEINYEKGIAESLRTQTNAHQLLSNFDLSFEKGIGALAHYRNLNDKEGEAYIITLLARNSYILGDYENSLKYNLLSMQIREAMNDIPGVISTLTNIGNIYGVKRDYDNALKHFLKGLELGVNHEGKTRPNSTSILLGNIGSIYAFKQEYHKALEYYFKSQELVEADDKTYTPNYSNIAEVYLMKGDVVNAEKYYSLGLTAATATENKHGEATCLLGFGKTSLRLKNTDEAIQHLENALNIVTTYSLKGVLSEVYQTLSEVYTQTKDYEKALDYHKKFYTEKEREFTEETDKKTQNLLVLHQVDTLKKESEFHRLSHDELKKLNEKIEDTNRRIMESIDYAKHIQDSILPHTSNLKQYFSESFVFLRPKDIISGDFFWMYEKENEILIAAVDCTGHGVSGALMSVVANSLLNQVTSNQWMPNPSFILNEVNHYMERTLSAHDDSGLRDSMDIDLCSISKTKTELLFAGAHNSMYLISEGVLTEYKGDNISMGNSAAVKFTNHRIKLKKGDCLYIFTDGFADQKGGPEGKKFYYTPFKDLIMRIHTQPMDKQKTLLDKAMYEWMGNQRQIDDMLVIGIKI